MPFDKQALGSALAVKRLAKKKKMNHGGEVDADNEPYSPPMSKQVHTPMRGAPKFAKGGEVQNQMLHPEHEGPTESMKMVLKQMDFSPHRQDQGPLPHPEQPRFNTHEEAEEYRKYNPDNNYPQSFASQASQDKAHFAKGGMLQDPKSMAKMILKKRNHLYKGGQPAGMHEVYPKDGSNETGDYDMDRDEYLADNMGDLEFDKHPHSWDQYEGDTGDTVPGTDYPYEVSSDGSERGGVEDDTDSAKKKMLKRIMSKVASN